MKKIIGTSKNFNGISKADAGKKPAGAKKKGVNPLFNGKFQANEVKPVEKKTPALEPSEIDMSKAEEMVKLFSSSLKGISDKGEHSYRFILAEVKQHPCTAKQIAGFAEYLKSHAAVSKAKDQYKENQGLGLFLSALINSSPDSDFKLDLTGLANLTYLGMQNKKRVEIFGLSPCDYAGMYSTAGKLKIHVQSMEAINDFYVNIIQPELRGGMVEFVGPDGKTLKTVYPPKNDSDEEEF